MTQNVMFVFNHLKYFAIAILLAYSMNFIPRYAKNNFTGYYGHAAHTTLTSICQGGSHCDCLLLFIS